MCRERYGVEDERLRRFRYGVQVNSLGLTEQQPENNVYRILIEMLAVTLSKSARARAVQLPAWNEALGLPRPWDQQWSLRMQQIMAYETDLLEYGDIFDGSEVIAAKVAGAEGRDPRRDGRDRGNGRRDRRGRGRLHEVGAGQVQCRRLKAIEAGEATVVGVNAFTETEASPLAGADGEAILTVSEHVEFDTIERLKAWRKARDGAAVRAKPRRAGSGRQGGAQHHGALHRLRQGGRHHRRMGAGAARTFLANTGRPPGLGTVIALDAKDEEEARAAVAALARRLGVTPKFLVGKPGLDGHSNGAEQIAVQGRRSGL